MNTAAPVSYTHLDVYKRQGLVLVMLPTLILYICVQRQLTQGMTVGGLKG